MDYKGFEITKNENGYFDVHDKEGRWIMSIHDTLDATKTEVDKLTYSTKPYKVKLPTGTKVALPMSEREFAEEPIDSEILDLVAELNYEGLATVMSCAGHSLGGGELPYGLIVFKERLNAIQVKKAKSTVRAFGLADVRIRHKYTAFPTPSKIRTEMTFRAKAL